MCPFLREFLRYLHDLNKHNVVILWTATRRPYIGHNLMLCDISNYFHHVLTYQNCKESDARYEVKKARDYISHKFPQYRNVRSVLVDDRAFSNSRGKYSHVYSVVPFTIRTVVEVYGALSTSPRDI